MVRVVSAKSAFHVVSIVSLNPASWFAMAIRAVILPTRSFAPFISSGLRATLLLVCCLYRLRTLSMREVSFTDENFEQLQISLLHPGVLIQARPCYRFFPFITTMSYNHQNQRLTINMATSWPSREPVQSGHDGSDPPKIPLPPFLPALNIEPESYTVPFDHSGVLEKAVLRDTPSYNTFERDSTYLHSSASSADVSGFQGSLEVSRLPPKRHMRLLRHLRLTFVTTYRRIFFLIFVLNLLGLGRLFRKHNVDDINLDNLATWSSANLLISILVRQDFFVNAIFRTAWLVPWRVPLRIRRLIARIYTYGGIHSGAAVAGTIWFLTFTCFVTIRFAKEGSYTLPVVILTWLILVLLVLILIFAFRTLRSQYHDVFEMTHRFLGWCTVMLFWCQLLSLVKLLAEASTKSFIVTLIRSPTFWNLVAITMLMVQPWISLRKWTFASERLSSHTMRLHFSHPVHRFSCLSVSTSPLKEWHPFATFPSTESGSGGASLIVSAAGDWTTSLLKSSPQTMHLWVKGFPKPGVLSLSCIFPRVVIVTTGSGIGPSLSSLLDRPAGQFCRLIWSTRTPVETFGKNMMAYVNCADPNALIIDTNVTGRPDLVRVAWNVYKEMGAEAVFVLSNESVTKKIVYGLESRGVPAFGPIWDS